ncbi:hypothetical protein TGAMA5MH_08442 [Trichoderma gamsii]|uniref:DUF3824 domain-containing protein n=1 Tax=Trichoderma gamsii TaxID=398673 RepID=A0A2K0T267_9HYPO|nr:hypothetical protein TGAMA5MH_08442 [Trichoderma gamsii]
MADYRTTKVYRERNDSDDDHFQKSTTVTRYKVNQPKVERYDRVEKVYEMDDERRSRYSGERDFVEYERRERAYVPDRPRSAVDVDADRGRTTYYERDVERRETDRDWDRRPRHHEEDVRVEKRVEERFDDGHGHEIDRYRKETEYYHEPNHASSPVVVRQRAPDQKIIVQEAPPQQIVIPRPEPNIIVLRERDGDRELARPAPYDEEYYYRRERREVGPYKGDRRPRRGDDYHSDDDDYYYSRRTTRRERSQSSDHHHKRHLAEGALAGAGITALLSSRPNEYGEVAEGRGKKVLAGAALGAIGTEAIRRAHSAYEDHWGDGHESPDRHSALKKGLGIAAVALAAAGAVKYHQASKAEKDERRRGRSRNRGGYYTSDDEYYSDRSRSRRPSRKRSLSTLAKAAIGTAATAGLVKHFRDKSKSRSKSRHGSRSRSKSTLRRGAELAAGAAAVGVAGKMWKDHHDKKKDREREESTSRGYSDEDHEYDRHNSHSRSRSRSRSRARSLYSEAVADPGLGLIEYGHDPLPPDPRSPTGQGYESEAEERRRNRRRRRERDPSSSSESNEERKRSRSRLRDSAAAGAAAAGIKEYKDRKERERKEEARREEKREERKEDRKERRSKERRSREREEQAQRFPKVPANGTYFEDPNRPHSPPNASGGAYFGAPYPVTPGSTVPGNIPPPAPQPPTTNVPPREHSYTPYTDPSVPEPREYHPYVPQDYHGYAPPPPPAGPPPPSGPPPPGNSSGVPGYARPPGPPPLGPAPPPGPPPPGPPAGGSFPQDYRP